MKFDYSRYIISLLITVAIFSTAFYISNYFSNKRVDIVKNIQENIAIDILSNETQFDLLGQVSCSNLGDNVLSSVLTELGNKLSRAEADLGINNPEVKYLKKYYSLLEIKDYLLSQRLSEKCSNKKSVAIIYLYSNVSCSDCAKQAAALNKLREVYPGLRVYTFDYDIDLSAVETLKKIFKLKGEFPIIITNDNVFYGLQDFDKLESYLPTAFKDKEIQNATTTATTTTLKARKG